MPIVDGVGTGTSVVRTPLTQRIEMAQTKAVRDALDEGVPVSHTEELLRRKDEARRAVLEEAE